MSIWMVLLASSLACSAPSRHEGHADTLWLLAASARNDAVHASDTERALRSRYGDSAVTRERVQLGEGETAPGLVLFASDPARRLEIQLDDTTALTTPTRVTVTGPDSRWVVYPGVTIGTHLDALERLNAGPFVLLGFGWDYGGTITSWSNGRLETLWPRSPRGDQSVLLRLARGTTAAEVALSRAVQGDRALSSRAMRKLNPHVYELSIRPR